MFPEYYNKQGEIIDIEEWIKLNDNPNYRIVKQDELSNGKWVSTVLLGLDHNFGGGKPLIFETMIFPSKGNLNEEYCQRYSTLYEAKIGHVEAVYLAQNNLIE